MKILLLLFPLIAVTALAADPPASATVSPPVLPASDLAAARDGDIILVDTRSGVEWECVRIPGATNIPGESLTESALLDVREKAATRPKLVFYGYSTNERTLVTAATKAQSMGFAGVHVLQGGIGKWNHDYPQRTLLFGQPADSELALQRRVSAKQLAEVTMPMPVWLEAAQSGKWTVIDVRRPDQRIKRGTIAVPNLITLTPDELVRSYRENALPLKLVLLIDYDESLMPWLVYYLRAFGVVDFRFAQGGSKTLEPATTAAPPKAIAPPPPPKATPPPSVIMVPPAATPGSTP